MSWLRLKPPRPDPGLDRFRNAIVELRKDGVVAGHLVITVESFWACGSPFRWQDRMWIYPFWLGEQLPPGTAPLEYRQGVLEDYPHGWHTRRELEQGYFEDADGERFDAGWLAGPRRADAKRILGLEDTDA
jgi:hypothetical protein